MWHELTTNQQRHWFLHHYEEEPCVYNLSRILKLTGNLDGRAICDIIDQIPRRHPVLCTRFETLEGQLRQSTEDTITTSTQLIDLSGKYHIEGEHLDLRRRLWNRRLDPGNGQVFNAQVVKLDESEYWVYLNMHPCVADHKTSGILIREIVAALEGETPSHHDTGFMSCLDGAPAVSDTSLRYWAERIGAPDALALPTFTTRPNKKNFAGHRARFEVPAPLASKIGALAKTNKTSEAVVFFSAYLVLLRRWTQQETVLVGRRFDLRPEDRPDAAGPFENMVPYRTDFVAPTNFSDFLQSVVKTLAADDQHAGIQFAELVEQLNLERDPARSPVFQAAFALTDAPLRLTTDRFAAQEEQWEEVRTPYDIEMQLIIGANGISGEVHTDASIYDSETPRRFAQHFIELLTSLADEPFLVIDQLECLNATERHKQLKDFNPPQETTPTNKCLTDLFSDAVRQFRDKPALSCGSTTLSYDELDRLSNQIARYLMGLGVSKNMSVGVCLDRSIDLVAAVLGILKAGSAYIPLDPSYPSERLAVIAQDSDARIIIANDRYTKALPSWSQLLNGDQLATQVKNEDDSPIARIGDPDFLAYIIFTSGSTGRPKGVGMPHRALVNLLDWQLKRKGFDQGAHVLQYSSLSFDVSFQEIFSTFVSGGHLFMIDDDDRRDPRLLLNTVDQCAIGRLFMPYVALRQLIDVAHATNRYPQTLREVITAGEQLRVDDALRSFFKRIGTPSLDNQYGPSETHVITAHKLEGDPHAWPDLPPIGRPVTNNQVFVMGPDNSLLPIGAPGELYLGGINLARGYVGRDDLTNDRFVSHPFHPSPAARVYKSGDLGRYRQDGTIEFLGRADEQIKIRGYRIEPGEINSVLAEFSPVRQAITRIIDGPNGAKRLVSYLRVDDPDSFDSQGIMRFAKERLPEYMVPSAVLPLVSFPFTPSGKVNIRALPVPSTSTLPSRAEPPAAPSTDTELALVQMWQELLNLDSVGVDSSFFELGGDSLKAVDLFLAIGKRFNKDLPLSVLAENSTIGLLAALIDNDSADDELTGYLALQRIQKGRSGEVPLFLVHGGGGNIVHFNALAKNIGADLPVYAFQWTGWNGGTGEQTIEDMVELYLRELTHFLPRGPVRIGGHCIGGIMALALASRLKGLGYRVLDPVIVMDSPNLCASTYNPTSPKPGSKSQSNLEALAGDIAAKVESCPPLEHPSLDSGRPPRLPPLLLPLGKLYGRIRYLLRSNTKAILDPLRLSLLLRLGSRIPIDLRGSYCAETMIRAAKAYKPLAYDGKLLLVRSGTYLGHEMGLSGWWTDPYLGFAELAAEGVDVCFANASHDQIPSHPYLGEVIRRTLSN